jgi:predicted nucleotidyltransferase
MNDVNMITAVSSSELEALCRKYHVRKLALFGSVLRDDFRADSDLDVLVEFEPDARIGLDFISLQEELSALFGRSVDLNTVGFLSRHFRQKVIDSAQVLYERGKFV